MGSFSVWHWLIVLLVVVLIFGTKKLRNLGSDLGGAVKGFKEGMNNGEDKQSEVKQVENNAQTTGHGQVIEGEVKVQSKHNV